MSSSPSNPRDPSRLDAPFAKVARAAEQIRDFTADLQAFFRSNPHDIYSTSRGRIEVWRIKPRFDLPETFNVRAGEILHNLRSPLDQMLSAIALQSFPDPTGVAFPFGKNKANFERNLQNQKKLPPEALQLIEGLRPYVFKGDALLAAVHYLNIGDKHHPGLTRVGVRTAANLDTLTVWRGRVFSIGPRNGRHLVLDKTNHFHQPTIGKEPRLEITTGGARMVFGVDDKVEPEMEIATSLPGTQFEAAFEPTFDVAFTDIEGVPHGHTAAEILTQMRELIERIVLTFKAQFFQ